MWRSVYIVPYVNILGFFVFVFVFKYAEVATATTNSLEKLTITDDAEPDILQFKDTQESLGKTDHVYKFLTLDLKPYYTVARNAVDKHTRSLARLKFLQQCLIENLALRELRYHPRLPQGLEANPDQILSWRNNIKQSEKGQMSVCTAMMQSKMLNFQDLAIKTTNELKAQLRADPQLLRAAMESLNSSSKDTSTNEQERYQKLLVTLRSESKDFEGSTNDRLFGRQRPPQSNRSVGTRRTLTPPTQGGKRPRPTTPQQPPIVTSVANTGNKSPANKRWKSTQEGRKPSGHYRPQQNQTQNSQWREFMEFQEFKRQSRNTYHQDPHHK